LGECRQSKQEDQNGVFHAGRIRVQVIQEPGEFVVWVYRAEPWWASGSGSTSVWFMKMVPILSSSPAK
jgi:hypothetical protein